MMVCKAEFCCFMKLGTHSAVLQRTSKLVLISNWGVCKELGNLAGRNKAANYGKGSMWGIHFSRACSSLDLFFLLLM